MEKIGFFKRPTTYLALVCGATPTDGCQTQFALETDLFHSGFFCKYLMNFSTKISEIFPPLMKIVKEKFISGVKSFKSAKIFHKFLSFSRLFPMF